MEKVLIIGAGGVSNVATKKIARLTEIFKEITLASRTKSKCDAIAAEIDNCVINTARVDADNVNEVVERIIDTIFIPDHIKVLIKRKLPTVKADPTRLQQLFQNLIGNAVNYIDKEKGLVEVDCSETSEFYIFSIKDNGVGIPKEYHEKIFKMFSTLGNYEKASGIGLNIVKKVVELYKGKIWIESEVGIGSTFFFSIAK